MVGTRQILRSIALLWAIAAACFILSSAGAIAAFRLLGRERDPVLYKLLMGRSPVAQAPAASAGPTGNPGPTGPAGRRSPAAGAKALEGLAAVAVLLMFFGIPLALWSEDPEGRGRLRLFLRRIFTFDRSFSRVVYSRIPGIRRIPTVELQETYAMLVFPFWMLSLFAGTAGGIFNTAFVLLGGEILPRTGVFLAVALQIALPLGLAYCIPIASCHALSLGIRDGIFQGRAEDVWETLRADLRWRVWRSRLAVSLAFFVLGAIVIAFPLFPLARFIAFQTGLRPTP